MVRSVCHPPFAKSREGWGTHCVVCHRKAGPPAIHHHDSEVITESLVARSGGYVYCEGDESNYEGNGQRHIQHWQLHPRHSRTKWRESGDYDKHSTGRKQYHYRCLCRHRKYRRQRCLADTSRKLRPICGVGWPTLLHSLFFHIRTRVPHPSRRAPRSPENNIL